MGSCSISRSGLLTYTRLRDGLINLAKSFCKEIQLLKGQVQNYVGLVLLEIWECVCEGCVDVWVCVCGGGGGGLENINNVLIKLPIMLCFYAQMLW